MSVRRRGVRRHSVLRRMLGEGVGHGVCEYRSFGSRHVLDSGALAGGRSTGSTPQRLQGARLRDLAEFPEFATHFALAYVGAE